MSFVNKILKEAEFESVNKYFKDVDENFYSFIMRDTTKFISPKEKKDIVNKMEHLRLRSGKGLPYFFLNPAMIVATQKKVDKDKVESMDSDNPPFVVKLNTVYYALDGHHRLANAIKNKEKKIKVRLLNLDK